ncbi:MAG TPA: hypothetical protein VHI93_00740 [Candidatus Thermoplasmatota archaeon]|nr:hypothetical protein [Candidatus Thermoplasmatota archaeon]
MALDPASQETTLRFLHVLSGIVWIGMLYFFNFVNLPLLKFQLRKPYEANMAEKATGPIVVKTLFFFRWGALFTLLFGLLLLGAIAQNYAGMNGLAGYFLERGVQGHAILLGILLALVMFVNVWFVIWPRQQKILANNKALASVTDDAEKKRLGDANAPMVRVATLASRTNTWLSIPMLWGMVFGGHGHRGTTLGDWLFPLVVLAALLGLMAFYSRARKPKA